jgi:hypothetical protein
MGLGAIIGGALTGVGRGMELQETERATERRDRRLAEARMTEQSAAADQAMAQVVTQQTMTGDREAADDMRGMNTSVKLKEIDFQNESTLGESAASAAAAEREAQRQAAIENREDEQAQEERMARVTAGLENANAAYKAQVEDGQIFDTFIANNGEVIGMTRSGRLVPSGRLALPEQPRAGSGSTRVLQFGQPDASASATNQPIIRRYDSNGNVIQ